MHLYRILKLLPELVIHQKAAEKALKLIDEDKNFENKFLVSKNKIPNDKDKGFDINQTDI